MTFSGQDALAKTKNTRLLAKPGVPVDAIKLVLSGLDVPDFLSVLTDGTVGGELGGGSHIHQALAAEGHAVGVIAVDLQRRNSFVFLLLFLLIFICEPRDPEALLALHCSSGLSYPRGSL